MYHVIDISASGLGNYGVALIGGQVVETFHSKRRARRRAKLLNSILSRATAGKSNARKRVKKS